MPLPLLGSSPFQPSSCSLMHQITQHRLSWPCHFVNEVMWTEHILKNQACMVETDVRPVRSEVCQNQLRLKSAGMTLVTAIGCDSSCAKQEGKRKL